MSEDIYKEIILDHYRNPRNKGNINDAEISAKDYNPVCGDKLTLDIKLENDVVSDIKFDGEGCAISQASASILTEMLMGKTLEDLSKFSKDALLEELGTPSLGPARIKCALLSLKVLKIGTYKYLGDELPKDSDAEL
ncbi:MAG: SUF system NifU family Fe-S cluster assembly protein [Thaumarchaeota archaeon]|nr:SUF system NifU family Fe-S cluster assembly protein [Nitrososphaerota archaeon]